jgi:hypothetical protein
MSSEPTDVTNVSKPQVLTQVHHVTTRAEFVAVLRGIE